MKLDNSTVCAGYAHRAQPGRGQTRLMIDGQSYTMAEVWAALAPWSKAKVWYVLNREQQKPGPVTWEGLDPARHPTLTPPG